LSWKKVINWISKFLLLNWHKFETTSN
jgi:hypothetical protein